jgi:hypothetical protein
MEVTTYEDERAESEGRHVGSPEVARRHAPHSDSHGIHGERRGREASDLDQKAARGGRKLHVEEEWLDP